MFRVAKVALTAAVLPLLGAQCDPPPPPPSVDSVIAKCVDVVPPEERWDCPEWDVLYQCLGATEREVAAMAWVRERESGCGQRLANPRTSDTGDCQLNGVHGKPGWSFGRRWDNGWAVDRFGLAPYSSLESWRSNLSSAEGKARLAAACLFLVRGSDDGAMGRPDAFRGCGHWQHRGWRSVCRR